MVEGNTIFTLAHLKGIGFIRGLMLRKVMPMQQLFEVNVKVRGRQTCVKILKLGIHHWMVAFKSLLGNSYILL